MERPAAPTIAFAICATAVRTELPGLCGRFRALLEETGAAIAVCDVGGVVVDAVTVDALARLQLEARRQGCQIRLQHASSELRELLAFMGLLDVLIG